MNVKKIIEWIGVACFAMLALAAFALGGIVSGIIFLLIAFICSPFRGLLLNLLPEKFNNKVITIVAAVVLSFSALIGIPTDSSEPVGEITEESVEKETTKEVATVEEKDSDEANSETSTESVEDVASDASTIQESEEKEESETESKVETDATSNTANSNNQEAVASTQTEESASIQTPANDVSNNQESTNNQSTAPANTGNANNFSTGTAPVSGSYYIVNSTNGKVHTSSCSRLPDNDHQIIYNTKEEVLNAGYSDPCGICKPW